MHLQYDRKAFSRKQAEAAGKISATFGICDAETRISAKPSGLMGGGGVSSGRGEERVLLVNHGYCAGP